MLLLHLSLRRWVKFVAAISIVCAVFFGFVGTADAAFQGACFYFEGAPQSDTCVTLFSTTKDDVEGAYKGTHPPCPNNNEFKIGTFISSNLRGAYSFSKSASKVTCKKITGLQSLKLAKGTKKIAGKSVSVKKWSDLASSKNFTDYHQFDGSKGTYKGSKPVDTSDAPKQYPNGCCLYFDITVKDNKCLNVNDIVTQKSTKVSCSGDAYKNAEIINTSIAGGFELNNKSHTCPNPIETSSTTVLNVSDQKLSSSNPKLFGKTVDVNKWCETVIEDVNGLIPGRKKIMLEAAAQSKNAGKPGSVVPVNTSKFTGCCFYTKGDGVAVNSSKCLDVSKLVASKNYSTSVTASSCTTVSKTLVHQGSVVPKAFEGGWAIPKANWKAPSALAEKAPNCLKIKDYNVKQIKFSATPQNVYGSSALSAKPAYACAAGIAMVTNNISPLGKLHSDLEEVVKELEGVAKEISDYLDKKKSNFCCIPKNKTTATSCYDPNVFKQPEDVIENAKWTIAALKKGTSKTTDQILDEFWNKNKVEFAQVFFTCTPQVSSSSPTKEVANWSGLLQSFEKQHNNNHYLVNAGCKDSAIPPIKAPNGKDYPPCSVGDSFCLDAFVKAYPGGFEASMQEWCKEKKKYCGCKAGNSECIDFIYLGEKESSEGLPKCKEDIKNKEGAWSCFEANPKKLSQNNTKAESCLEYVVKPKKEPLKKFECGDGKKIPIVTPATQEEILLKQVCNACKTKTVKLKDGEKDCTKVIELPDIEVFPNPLGGSGINNPQSFIANLIKTFLGILGSIALALVVYGGFVWMTSAGQTERVETGRKTVQWAVFGLVAVFASYAIVKFIFDALG